MNNGYFLRRAFWIIMGLSGGHFQLSWTSGVMVMGGNCEFGKSNKRLIALVSTKKLSFYDFCSWALGGKRYAKRDWVVDILLVNLYSLLQSRPINNHSVRGKPYSTSHSSNLVQNSNCCQNKGELIPRRRMQLKNYVFVEKSGGTV